MFDQGLEKILNGMGWTWGSSSCYSAESGMVEGLCNIYFRPDTTTKKQICFLLKKERMSK